MSSLILRLAVAWWLMWLVLGIVLSAWPLVLLAGVGLTLVGWALWLGRSE